MLLIVKEEAAVYSNILWTKRLMLLLLIVAVSGCGGDGDNLDVDTGVADSETASDTEPEAEQWHIMMVDSSSIGMQTKIKTAPDNTVGIATFANESYEDGICTEVASNPPKKLKQSIYFASKKTAEPKWTVEKVADPVVVFAPSGLSLDYDGNGQAAVAYTGGKPQKQFCGANDAVIALRTKSGWKNDTASRMSGDSKTGIVGSDEGMVVGYWPGLAYNSKGEPALIHKDVHFGALQSIDSKRADAEFAIKKGGKWVNEAIDAGAGAGDYGTVLFDQQERAVVFYYNPREEEQGKHFGLWAARRGQDGKWKDKVRLFNGVIHQEISAVFNQVTKEIVVAYYSADHKAVRISRLADSEDFADETAWSNDVVGNAIYDEGQYVSLAITPSGKEVLAYHRCKKNSSVSDGCDDNDEAAVIAVHHGDNWDIEAIDQAEHGSCGEYTAVTVDSSGRVYVAYRCTVTDDNDKFVFRLFVADKKIED